MKTILHGQYYRSHPYISSIENSLGIVLYYDELEIVNPLGSRTHKLGMFYWTLANVYPEYRSTLRAVNLLCIAKYSHIVKYGMHKVLERFVRDVNILQTEGINIPVNGVEKNFKGSLLIVTGDTPASALLGGFKKSVSKTIRPCRRCFTDQDRWKLFSKESFFTLRDPNTHQDHVSAVTDADTTQSTRMFWSRAYGVNDRSPLLDINGLDITKCLVQDVMHVMSEGVMEVATRALIKWCVDGNFFSLHELSSRIEDFDYGHLVKDKPSNNFIPEHLTNGLRQSSAQMICLSHVLPFLISDRLIGDDGGRDPEAHERLLCHVRMLQITNFSFAFEISEGSARLLGHLIDVFIYKFNTLFPNCIVPKIHFLVHLPKQIIEFGPARQHFCMRFEATHSWFKSLRVLRNYLNMPWSLSCRFEALRCLELSSVPRDPSVKFLYAGHQIKEGSKILLRNLENGDEIAHSLAIDNADGTEIMISPEIHFHGTMLKTSSVILLHCEEDDLPVFGKVDSIIVHTEKNIGISITSTIPPAILKGLMHMKSN